MTRSGGKESLGGAWHAKAPIYRMLTARLKLAVACSKGISPARMDGSITALALAPDSSLAQAVSGLPFFDVLQAATCSRRWLQLGSGLTHLPAISSESTLPTLHALPLLTFRFPQLGPSLTAMLEGNWKPTYLDALQVGGHLIQRLQLQLAEGVGELELSCILQRCPNLVHFHLSDYDLVGQDIQGRFLRELPQQLRELRL